QKDDSWHAMVRDTLRESPATKEITHPATGDAVLRYQVTPHAPAKDAVEQADTGPVAMAPMPSALLTPPPPPPPLPRPLSPSGAGAVIEPEPTQMLSPRSPVLDAHNEPSFAIERGTAAHRLLQVLPSLEE